jgi:hypothetical protein
MLPTVGVKVRDGEAEGLNFGIRVGFRVRVRSSARVGVMAGVRVVPWVSISTSIPSRAYIAPRLLYAHICYIPLLRYTTRYLMGRRVGTTYFKITKEKGVDTTTKRKACL